MSTSKWQRRWKRIKNVPGLLRNLIAVAVAIALGTTTTVIVLANVKFIRPMESRYEVTAEFESAPAVIPDLNPKVRIAGVDVGQVTDSEVSDDGNARLTLSLEEGHEVYDNAKVLLRPKSVLNEMYVEIDPGGPPGKKLPDGGAIDSGRSARPIQGDEVLEHLDERTRAGLTSLLAMSDTALADAPADLPAGLDATDATFEKFQPVIESLRTRRVNIAKLVTAVTDIARSAGHNRERVGSLASSLQNTLSVLSARDTELSQTLKQLPGTTRDLKGAMTGMQGLSRQLNPTLQNVSEASKKLTPTLKKTSSTVTELGRTVRAARPVVSDARPLITALGPVVDDVQGALGDLEPISKRLDPATATLVPYLNDVAAFVYNTSGVFASYDANGGFVRGHVAVPLPDAGLIAGSHGGNPSRVDMERSKK